MDATRNIQRALEGAFQKLGLEVKAELDHPADLSHGDYSSNAALVAAKKAGKNPRALAEEIVAALGAIEGVEKIEIAGAGFINFTLARKFYPEATQEILKQGDTWGRNDHVKGYKVVVEYAQPNPFKPFHIGHLMSTTVGESVSRFVEFSGADTFRVNYQGDIGPHVAKAIWSIKKKGGIISGMYIDAIGKAYTEGAIAYEEDPTAKKEIDEINQQIYEKSDPLINSIYAGGRSISLEHFEELYKVLNTRFDHYFFESETAPVGLRLVEEGKKKGVFEESDGAIVYKGEKKGLHTRVFVTSRGLPLYETKELGLMQMKKDLFPYDLNVTTVAVEQDSYFKVVEAAIEDLLPDMKGKYTHVAFGMMQLSSGKMSSRKGNIVTGESLIEDMRAKAFAKMEGRDLGDAKQDVADAVAVAAIKYGILKQARGKNIIFDPEASLSFEGDSGPYLQYSYVRAQAILRKAKEEDVSADTKQNPDTTTGLERLLYRFPEVVVRAASEYEPHYVTTYLTELASVFNSWYAQEKIVDAGDTFSPYKVALTRAFAHTMKNGLWLLGIQTPERM